MKKLAEKLNRRYVIEGDDINLKLVEKYEGSQSLKTYSTVLGYFANLKQLKLYTINHLIKVDGIEALEGIERKLKGILKVEE